MKNYRKEKNPATVRNSVWLKYVGNQITSICFCCKLEPITRGGFECGHVVSEKSN